MLDSIYHMTLKLLENCILGMKASKFCHLLCSVIMDVIMLRKNLSTTSGLSILLHGVIPLPDVTSYDNGKYTWFLSFLDLVFWS